MSHSPTSNGPSEGSLGARFGAEIDRIQRLALVVALVGLGLTVALAFVNGVDWFFRSYFYGFLYILAFPLASIGLLCINHLAFGTWGILIRRLLESSAATVVLLAILSLPILSPPGLRALYPWARVLDGQAGHATEGAEAGATAAAAETESAVDAAHAEAAQPHGADAAGKAGAEGHSEAGHGSFHSPLGHKAAWFGRGFFYGRALGYFLLWGALAYFLNTWSREQDGTRETAPTQRLKGLAAPGLILLFLSGTFALFDWSMSLDTNWYSTIYGGMLLIGMAQATLAFTLIVFSRLIERGAFGSLVTITRLRDLGNLLLALTMLWAYTSFSQFLIMWSGNIAEEVPWYLRRSHGGWQFVVAFLMIFGFFGPFIALLFRGTKQDTTRIRRIATFILFVHVIDVLWIVGPDLGITQLTFGYLPRVAQCLAALAGLGGLWLAAYLYFLRGKAILPENDPGLIAIRESDQLAAHGHAHPA